MSGRDDFNPNTETLSDLVMKLLDSGARSASGVIGLGREVGVRFRFDLVTLEDMEREHDDLLANITRWRETNEAGED